MRDSFPKSIAIAGAWGYIGGKFLEASRALGLRTYVYDPGLPPDDLDWRSVTRLADEGAFYRLNADLFHLAVHPEYRKSGTTALLKRAANEPLLILVEKPMAPPERPEECGQMIDTANNSRAVVLYDFPELFSPMTRRICDFLSGFRDVKVTSIFVQRSKDREDPDNPRNYKRMVPIQYQETVHCLAFALNLLATLRGDIESVFANGLSVTAKSEPYSPPNPETYPCVVDGKCDFALMLGDVEVVGHTNFKKGAEATKRRIIRGVADGKPFAIDAEYQEGRKRLVIDGEDQGLDPDADSYESVIKTLGQWYQSISARDLMRGIYPNPEFARVTYQLSSILWRSSRDKTKVELDSLEGLISFDAGFGAALAKMPRYTRA
jgi:predicted dehydrogenase